uniref:Uncharacterized protein n=1 Tax=Brassica oleracea var. oleracea TaxID=109376 RepID=A0A0D3AMM3_BRAOL
MDDAETGYVLHMVVHAYHSNIIQDFVCVYLRSMTQYVRSDCGMAAMVKKNQLSCSRTKHILPKIFITHGLQKIGEVQRTFKRSKGPSVMFKSGGVMCVVLFFLHHGFVPIGFS